MLVYVLGYTRIFNVIVAAGVVAVNAKRYVLCYKRNCNVRVIFVIVIKGNMLCFFIGL